MSSTILKLKTFTYRNLYAAPNPVIAFYQTCITEFKILKAFKKNKVAENHKQCM
jgi:hypothetical protein